jgi:enterochelin esterase-like enzyme
MNLQGSIVRGEFDSKLLRKNLAGESAIRPLTVYVPEAAKSEPGQRFPVLYYLPAWLNAGRSVADWQPFKESVAHRIDRLISEGKLNPCVVVAVDLYTSFGGSQYVNSSYFGPHADHIVQELFPYIEKNFPVLTGAQHRGIFGKSSGGFGALRLAMDFPNQMNSVLSLSGDVGFELLVTGNLVDLPNHLVKYDKNPLKYLNFVKSASKLTGKDLHILMLLGNAGFYSPDSSSAVGFSLPIDLYSGEISKSVMKQWYDHDPLFRAESAADNLKKLKYFRIECGTRDQYNLLYGSRQLHKRLDELKVNHVYQEFEDDHSGIDYRYDVALPEFVNSLS